MIIDTEHALGREEDMFINLDQNLCTGCGSCIEICPKVFTLNDADCAELLMEEINSSLLEELAYEAAELCPANCIEIEE